LKILIVEDEVRISTLLKMYLGRESFEVTVVDNGIDGLEQSLNVDHDLIILDVFMPGINGFTVLEELRKIKDTPVIMLSAQSEEQGKALGANAFISKPFSPGAVVEKVKEILLQNK
jgi:DNA-binding response OmpR family regulator